VLGRDTRNCNTKPPEPHEGSLGLGASLRGRRARGGVTSRRACGWRALAMPTTTRGGTQTTRVSALASLAAGTRANLLEGVQAPVRHGPLESVSVRDIILASRDSLGSVSVRDVIRSPGSPSLQPLYTTLSRRKHRAEAVVWSPLYRCACMLLALGVGALPVGLGFVMALFDSETTAAGSGTVAAPTAQSARCLPTEMLRINATTTSSKGVRLAAAWLIDEGPRDEFRRPGRAILSDARAQAVRDGMRVFAFEPCAMPPGMMGLLTARSAVEACRLGRAVAAHRCPPSPSPPSRRRIAQSAAGKSSPAKAMVAPQCRDVHDLGREDGVLLAAACAPANNRSGTTEEPARPDDSAAVLVDGCRMGCAGTGRSRRREGRGLRAQFMRDKKQLQHAQRRKLQGLEATWASRTLEEHGQHSPRRRQPWHRSHREHLHVEREVV
jgi:hypothetical protein